MISRITTALKSRRNELDGNEKGFTLIELLVVVIIIGILAAIAIPVYMGIQNNAKDSAVQSDVTNAKTAVVASLTETGTFPTTLVGLTGYTAPNSANYGTVPTLYGNADAFCVQGVSVTGTSFAASDTTGVAKGSCSEAGAFVAPSAG